MYDSQASCGAGRNDRCGDGGNDPFLASLTAVPPPLHDGRAHWERPSPRPPLAGDGSDCDDVVVERLAALAASAVPLRRVLAALAGRFVRTKGWERLAYARLDDYATERLGLSARQVGELARVEESLATLPHIEAALLSGQLSWTKARLLCRVATAEDEQHWLDVAADKSAQALSREVRRVDARALENGGADPPPEEELRRRCLSEDDEPREAVRVQCTHHVHGKWRVARLLAVRLAGRPLKQWEAAEWVAAEVMSAIGLDATPEDETALRSYADALEGLPVGRASEAALEVGIDRRQKHGAHEPARSPLSPAGARSAATPSGEGLRPTVGVLATVDALSTEDALFGLEAALMPEARDAATSWSSAAPVRAINGEHAPIRRAAPAPALPASLHALVHELENADAFALDARLRRAVKLERLHLSQLAPWLLEVSRKRLFQDLGYRSLDAYAHSELGLASSKARALVRLERVALVSPCFREAWRRGDLSWTQAEALAPLFELEQAEPWQAAWLEHAQAVTVRRLRDEVSSALAFSAFEPGVRPADPAGLPTGAKPRDWEQGIGAWRSGDEWGSLDPLADPPVNPPADPAVKLLKATPPAGVPTGAQPTNFAQQHPALLHRQNRAELRFYAPLSVARLFHAVLATVQRRIEAAEDRVSSESEALNWMLEHVFEEWGRYRPVPARYKVYERDGFRCAVPGCSGYRDLHVHHIEFRSRGGNDDPENLVTMCAWHHLRATHGRAQHGAVMSCRGRAPRGMRFSLGLRETGPPMAVYRSGDRVVTA